MFSISQKWFPWPAQHFNYRCSKRGQLVNTKNSIPAWSIGGPPAKVLQQLVKPVTFVRKGLRRICSFKNANEITLLDIYEAIEGPIKLIDVHEFQKCAFKTCILGDSEQLNQKFEKYGRTKAR